MPEEDALPERHCYRCIYTWIPRRLPVGMCPRCKSRLWDQPKLRIPIYGGGLGIEEILGAHRGEIRRLAKKYGARGVMVFGSVARRQADRESDVDLLVEWRRHRPRLARLALMSELKRLLGRDVEVLTEEDLYWSVRPQVLAEARPL
jgi:predicted nucleotidyltransferase